MNSTTDHTIDQDTCLACQEEHQAPMTLPDDIELREALMQLVVENQYIDGMTEYMPDTALDSTMELIATYRKKWEAEARLDEVENFSALDQIGTLDRLNNEILYIDRRKRELRLQGADNGL